MKMLGLVIACGALLLTTAVRAAETEKTIAIGGNLSAQYNEVNIEGGPTVSATSIAATPTFDVLSAGGLTLGVSAQFARTSSTNIRATFVQPAGQLGYYVPIGEYAAFWPIARAGYGFASSHHEGTTGPVDATSRTLELALVPQVLLLPTKSFFVRFSPGMLAYRVTTVGASGGGMIGMSPLFAVGVGVML